MAQISVNDEYIINGKLTVQRSLTDEGDVTIIGSFATHYYFEEIKSLETFRYSIREIEVREETFGSDDFDIAYSFIAKSFDVKNDMSNLTIEEIGEIESKVYDEEGYVIGSNMSTEVK